MNLSLLQTLTWSTVAGAVVSALALAATEPGAPAMDKRSVTARPQGPLVLPVEPTGAGRPTAPAASAPGQVATPDAAH